jgi:ATP-binding cassette subfamily B protein
MTDAGEMGKKLSTGEKQLISIARAMLRNPAVVILDEALSSVDPYTERIVRNAIRRLMKGRTGIIIAHRLSTALESDRVVVIENGQIVEEGTPKNLIARRGKYFELFKDKLELLRANEEIEESVKI